MDAKDNSNEKLLELLQISPFRQRFPWIGGDLQTLRDTLRTDRLPNNNGKVIKITIPEIPNGSFGPGQLLAFLDTPASPPLALVLMLHGLGGSSQRQGLRRMAATLEKAGFAVLRLNLRGAHPGRHLAGGTYAASCNSDIRPVLIRARKICEELCSSSNQKEKSIPLLGVGISLGGTILLNACLEEILKHDTSKPLLDGLACTSSPLNLVESSSSIERPRNKIYQRWLLKRLIHQTLEDPFGISDQEKNRLKRFSKNNNYIRTIREFDETITAPRWGYKNVDSYYLKASPYSSLVDNSRKLPPTLLLQAKDDPWVPSNASEKLNSHLSSIKSSQLKIYISKHGGHNGFHAIDGCWGDKLVKTWFNKLIN